MNFLVVFSTLAAYTTAKPLAGYALAPIPGSYYAPMSYAAPPYPYPAAVVAAPTGVKTQYYAQDMSGRVSYGFADPTQTQSVIQDAAGNKVGSFSFINAEGKLVQANYIADTLGYRVLGSSNDLASASQEQPKSAEEAPEVAEAKAKYFADYEQSKNQNPHEASPEQGLVSASKSSETAPAAPVVHPLPIAYAPITYASHIPIPIPPQFAPYGYPVHYPYPFVISTQ